MRALADLAFMLQDYDTCASTLRLLGPELKADKAWKHYAGCQVGAGGVDDHGNVLTCAQVQADTCYADWYPGQAWNRGKRHRCRCSSTEGQAQATRPTS